MVCSRGTRKGAGTRPTSGSSPPRADLVRVLLFPPFSKLPGPKDVRDGISAARRRGRRRILAEWRTISLFLIKFTFLSLPVYLLLYMKADFTWAQVSIARQVAAISGYLGVQAVADGYLVRAGTVILEIIEACVAWKDMFAFAALVLATPGRNGWKRLAGIVVGVPVIYATNIARLVVILLYGVARPELVGLVHAILWKFGMIAAILLAWLTWLWWTDRPGKSGADSPSSTVAK